MELTVEFIKSYSQIIIPVSAFVFLIMFFMAPHIGFASLLNKKMTPLLVKKHKTKKDIKNLIYMFFLADIILVILFTTVTYWLMNSLFLI